MPEFLGREIGALWIIHTFVRSKIKMMKISTSTYLTVRWWLLTSLVSSPRFEARKNCKIEGNATARAEKLMEPSAGMGETTRFSPMPRRLGRRLLVKCFS